MSLHLLIKSLLRRKVVTVLLLVQLAMTLALLINSLLLAMQTRDKLNEPTGLNLPHTLQVQLKPTTPDLRAYPLLGDLLERQMAAVRALPGVNAVAYANQGPVREGGNNGNLYDAEAEERTNIPTIPQYMVSPDFFAALGLSVVDGQLPKTPVAVDIDTPSPLVLTRRLAEKLFPGRSSIGLNTNRAPVAAVVEDFFGQATATDPVYNSMQVSPLLSVDWGYALLINTSAGSTEQIRQQLPEVLRQVDANIEVFYVRSLEEQHQLLYRNEFGLATLLGILSGLMLLVAMVSSYSNAHFHALKQQQEIGIKRALGASKQLILLELLSENWLTTLLGAVLGAVVGVLLNHALATVISLEALNWWLPVICSLVLLVCVTFATWYPARIATAVSPATATKTL
jgi:putative ABC transport system permease protein